MDRVTPVNPVETAKRLYDLNKFTCTQLSPEKTADRSRPSGKDFEIILEAALMRIQQTS